MLGNTHFASPLSVDASDASNIEIIRLGKHTIRRDTIDKIPRDPANSKLDDPPFMSNTYRNLGGEEPRQEPCSFPLPRVYRTSEEKSSS